MHCILQIILRQDANCPHTSLANYLYLGNYYPVIPLYIKMKLKLFLLSFLVCTPVFAQAELEEAFPELSFSRPVDLQHPGDDSDLLFVLEQHAARIQVFENDPNTESTSVFLNLSSKVRTNGNEEGLLGLAFHPNYENNGYFYVYYSASSPRRSVVERYQVSSDPLQADANSGLVLLEVGQFEENHNGGQIAFGPDGYLYIALGDGGDQGDPQDNGENPQTLLGSILRVDVDNPSGGNNYGIPADNPFVGNGLGYREEVYAYGFRNPWRMSFDVVTGELWVGDVGQGSLEEIDIVVKGGDYGWNYMEGTNCYEPQEDCETNSPLLPIWEYGHSDGQSITGGHVYRGSRLPALYGKYIYGDYASGLIWTLTKDGNNSPSNELIYESFFNIPAFGVDKNNELYILGFNGKIYQFEQSGGLPVSLTSFEGIQKDDEVQLEWETDDEINNSGFEVQKKIGSEGVFSKIGFVPGQGSTTENTTYQYVDGSLGFESDTLYYRLKQIDFDGTFDFSPTVEIILQAPVKSVLYSSYPNPFNPSTTIRYQLAAAGRVKLIVSDVTGKVVDVLIDDVQASGRHEVVFDATGLPSGMYFYQLLENGNIHSGKMTLVK